MQESRSRKRRSWENSANELGLDYHLHVAVAQHPNHYFSQVRESNCLFTVLVSLTISYELVYRLQAALCIDEEIENDLKPEK
jgi:hypothetical protein